ncbi:MAG: SPFH domain-containing protein [Lentisphaeraceae bacterium]|nr:SPFH domain-containing protein [Lentisphaeraceae bacterium]
MKNNKITIFISSLTLLIVLTVMCTFQLKVDEVAVVTTFGSPKAINKPGLYFRWPWPVQKLIKIDSRKQLFQGRERETMTKDNINIIVKLFVVWSVNSDNPLEFYKKVGEGAKDAERQIASLVESKQETVIRSYALNDFLNSTGGSKISKIEGELKQAINDVTSDKYGLTVHKVALTKISLHEKNSESVLARMKQEQSKIAAEIRSTAEKEAQLKRNEADTKRAEILAAAEAESKQIRDEVRVKSAELFANNQQDQDFAAFLRQLDALKEIMKTQTTAFLSPDVPPFDLFKKEVPSNEDKK